MLIKTIREPVFLFLVDVITINLAWLVYYLVRIQSEWFYISMDLDFWLPMIIISCYWIILFFLSGLYRSWYTKSRIDEFIAVFKVVTFGVLFLFFAIFLDDRGMGSPLQSRLQIALYWALMLIAVSTGRFLLHTSQRRLLEKGIGLQNTLIVGWTDKARELCDMVQRCPALGYRIVGFLSSNEVKDSYKNIPIVGTIEQVQKSISEFKTKNLLIALDSSEHDQLLSVIAACDGQAVSLKVIPDLYDIISGQARTNQIYGFPLIEIMPELMPPWERAVKRALDITFSLLILLVGLPVWILIAIVIKLDSKGPVFYTQERVGKDGKHFRIIKFRSMYEDAETHSGPMWANKQDPRVTRIGKVIRKLRVDEVPQLINVLAGHMSLVGPRPERPFFVEQLSKEIPFYKRRLKVKPGITGWAQVKHKYDETIEDVKKKVKYDLFYIENMSLRMDLKIILYTIAVVFSGKGH